MRSKVRKICRLLSIIDRIRIGCHSRLDKQWRPMRILSIYATNTTFSVHWSASRLTNFIIQPSSRMFHFIGTCILHSSELERAYCIALNWNVHTAQLWIGTCILHSSELKRPYCIALNWNVHTAQLGIGTCILHSSELELYYTTFKQDVSFHWNVHTAQL